MGHYNSELFGPPFTIEVDCEINDKQKKDIVNRFLIGKKERVYDIKLTCDSITIKEGSKWFYLHYRLQDANFGYFKSVETSELCKILGEKALSNFEKELEQKRKYFLETK